MIFSFGPLRKLFLGLPLREAEFARRGFYDSGERTRLRLELVGKSVVQGYNMALEEDDHETLEFRLNTVDREIRGLAYEGAGMGLMMLDLLTPWRRDRFDRFIQNAGDAHVYIMHIGAGLAHAVLGRTLDAPLRRMDRFYRWLVVDGYGFFHGFFRTQQAVVRHEVPAHMTGYARRAFDHGLGRSLWFVSGGHADRLAEIIHGFSAERHPDLWSGVGLACAYAGGVERSTIERVGQLAGANRRQVALGTTLAARARGRAGNQAPHTDVACRVLFGKSAADIEQLTEDLMKGLPEDTEQTPAWEVWRLQLQEHVHLEQSV